VTALAPAPNPQSAAFSFLAEQHDLFHQHFCIYDDRDSGGSHFFPSGWMGDLVHYSGQEAIVDDAWRVNPGRGNTCTRIVYPEDLDNQGWIAIFWQPPGKDTWNAQGYDLSRYCQAGERVRVSFLLRGETGREVIDFKVGGMAGDSFGQVSRRFRASRSWDRQQLEIPEGADLSHVVAGFCLAADRQHNDGFVVYLDDIRFEFGPQGTAQRLAEPRFVRSYVPLAQSEPDDYFRNTCFLYDNALMVLAWCARGRGEDLIRARNVCDAILAAQRADPQKDGRLRNCYSCGDLFDLARSSEPRMPGWWDDASRSWNQDGYSLGSDAGNLAWTMLALLTFAEAESANGRAYVEAAKRIGAWVFDHCHSATGLGGYTGGIELTRKFVPEASTWKSTEHAIDLAVAFRRLGDATAEAVWYERADHAKEFVLRMIDAEDGHLRTGTLPDGKTINESPIPLDVATWAILAFPGDERFIPALRYSRQHHWYADPVDRELIGPDFDTDLAGGVWFEGCGQAALAFRAIGELEESERCLRTIRVRGLDPASPGAVLAASKDGLTTGFSRWWGEWVYWKRLHAGGATCWTIFARMGWNPYWARPVEQLR
jgi:hypothetical protein